MASPNSRATGPQPPVSSEPPSQFCRSLDRLPSELLRPIAEALVPACPSTTRFALRASGTWESRNANHQWADWLACHRELQSFAQTSRRMAAIAKPLLYHTLVIPTPRALVTLFRRIESCPAIRPWIRSITCLVNVASIMTVGEVHEEWQRQTGVSWARHSGTYDTYDNIALILLKVILENAPNLRDFLMACPDSPLGAEHLELPVSEVRDILYLQAEDYELAVSNLFDYFSFGDMQNLASLRIYCHRENGSRQLSLSRLLADRTVETLNQLTQVKTLELCCAAAHPVLDHSIELPPLPHIEHLRLYGSDIHEPRLVALCLACVNLQTLVVHFESSSTDEDRDVLPEGKTLSNALAGLAGSLRTLELVALSEGHYLTRGTERPRKPENHRLRCIPELAHLETLTLDYRGVFGTLGILEEDDGERLCQLLPPSLRDFTLVCEWGTARDWKQSYLADLDMVLHGVRCLCASPAHRQLSSISLAIHSWPAERRFHKRFKREVETARQLCARAGIVFRTFDLLPTYQDEDEVPPSGEEEEELEAQQGGEDSDDGGVEPVAGEEELELEEEDEASEYYFSGDEESDPEREARRPPTFNDFLQRLGEDHGHSLDELFYAYHEDRWDDNARDANPYVAVSYVWGDAAQTRPITLDSAAYPVTCNLFAALTYLRNSSDETCFWIDSLCINQQNLAERSAQVARMREIYSLASQVTVWLGDYGNIPKHDLHLGYQQACERANRAMHPTRTVAKRLLYSDEQNARLARGRDAMDGLLARPWFTRVLMVGHLTVPWFVMYHAFRHVRYIRPEPDDGALPEILSYRSGLYSIVQA
ncbi:hypothetical protein N657DRAFT_684751 [Parathielavia appendiculata]|uniref:Heterokaryon incompatibility domain-containing protein n=1 Tax=Parathielavia appendiculata TaxID=2587402 RepID=A0AAN6TS57_9PEZI|nr:hypothetical protein N657DRAFT_684751 [Parathielavia appendiculata]